MSAAKDGGGRGIWKRLFRLEISDRHLEEGLDEELAYHLEERIDEFKEAGMTEPEASHEAHRRFGNLEGIRDQCRRIEHRNLDQRRRRDTLRSIFQDIHFALRTLLRTPAFSVVALMTLALGIGGSTAIFSIVNGILLRPLPYAEPDRLVVVWGSAEAMNFPKMPFSELDFIDFREQSRTLDLMVAMGFNSYDVIGAGDPQRVQGMQVTPDLFPALGVDAMLGRVFREEDATFGEAPVAVLEYTWWRDAFGADPGVVGTSIQLNGVPHTIVGVMPEGVQFPPPITLLGQMLNVETRIWVPYIMNPEESPRDRHGLFVVGRMADGIGLDQVNEEVAAIAARLAEEYPDSNQGLSAWVEPIHSQSVQQIRGALWILLGTVAFVLLIACANVANLLLARASTRTGEIAIRMAVGAGRGRLVRQLLIESLVLAGIGGVLGLVFSIWGAGALIRINPIDIPSMFQPHLDVRVLLFSIGITLLTGVIFGLTPALQTARSDLCALIGEGGRTTGGPGRHRIKKFLVVFETAVTLILLTGAGLMIRSFKALSATDPGFDAENVLSIPILLPSETYPDAPQQIQFFATMDERFRVLPGVQSVSYCSTRPFTFDLQGRAYQVEGEAPPESGTDRIAHDRSVSPGFMTTLAISLVAGRFFDDTDTPDSEPVVLVNEAFARQHAEVDNLVGRRLTPDSVDDEDPRWIRIAGIIADTHTISLSEPDHPAVYYPFSQLTGGYGYLLVRTTDDPESMLPTLQRIIWEYDDALVLQGAGPITDDIRASMQESRFSTVLFTIFGAVALLLAAIGLYGVVSYTVGQMNREIGIRIAFGAHPTAVLKQVLNLGLVLTGLGIAIGVVGALLTTRFLQSFLIGISTTDIPSFLAAVVVLFTISVLATLVPACRAIRIDPIRVLNAL